MTRKYFGTDGIRGRANTTPMTVEVAMKVGMAAGVAFRRGDHRHRVVIGKDTRLSGYMIENALVAGFTASGMDVFQLGPVPTPAVAMLTRSMRADIGVMISASHNAFHDNGIKLFGPEGYKLSDEIELAIEDFGRRARENQLSVDELQGGTFTISNGGIYGSLLSTPIVNPPQSGILGLHAIQERPIALNGQVVIRPMMYVALTYDHRIVDGREAVTFLKRIKELMEEPARILLEV